MTYIWQKKNWTQFNWDSNELITPLAKARKCQGYLLGKADFLKLESEADLFVEEAYQTSSIEGEALSKKSIRSSVAKRLGLTAAGLPEAERKADGLVQILVDATKNYHTPLTNERLWGWQAGLFPTGYSGIRKLDVGKYRSSTMPMQVISGPMGKEKVHFEAPPSISVGPEMKRFLSWFNSLPNQETDGIIKAALTHFWFITIHPFEDGNGRIARAITDMALAQDEKSSRRLYSLSSAINKHRTSYYKILESCQKSQGDLTPWLTWFLEIFCDCLESSKSMILTAEKVSYFYQNISQSTLNARQQKVIDKIIRKLPEEFEGGLSNKKYVSITKTSPESAKRDLRDLLDKGILLKNEGKGRAFSYRLNEKLLAPPNN
ncbi:Fic family protein [Pseudobacteriovorax antillogorgiicola]|nr:Fic family protein [Pseudobacteriovorax antillogorgiicola]